VPMRVAVLIQLISQVLPPSAEKACSSRLAPLVMSPKVNRTKVMRPLTGS
jgi:hypothetical protein